jgi:hypothetical protein
MRPLVVDLLVRPRCGRVAGVAEGAALTGGHLPAGAAWRDAWGPGVSQGGRNVIVPAEPHQIPIFVRVGSTLDLGDLSRECDDAQPIARERPNLRALEADVIRWFAARAGKGPRE